MGYKKLLGKMTDFFSLDARERQKRKDELNQLLARLKTKEDELKADLERAEDEEQRVEIEKKINLVHSQRKKGVEMLKELMHES